MARTLKRPNGWVLEEYITCSGFLFENGEIARYSDGCIMSDHTAIDGEYTGRIAFYYLDGKITKWYTVKNAPLWLKQLYLEATQAEKIENNTF